MNAKEEAYFRILRAIELNPSVTQPLLADQLGISLGKINYLVKALVEKGLIKIGNFQSSGKKLNKIAYLLTPEGFRNRIRLTRKYMELKEREYEALKRELEGLRLSKHRPQKKY